MVEVPDGAEQSLGLRGLGEHHAVEATPPELDGQARVGERPSVGDRATDCIRTRKLVGRAAHFSLGEHLERDPDRFSPSRTAGAITGK